MFTSFKATTVITTNKKKQQSLNLLKVNALNAAFKVDFFATQKFIKTKEVNPISSQAKKRITRLPAETSKIILIINILK